MKLSLFKSIKMGKDMINSIRPAVNASGENIAKWQQYPFQNYKSDLKKER